jgi:hypothetical protein
MEDFIKNLSDTAVDLEKLAEKIAGENDSFSPPQAVRRAAALGLELREKFKRGGTMVGVARARDLSNGSSVSKSTIARMVSYFARHQVDSQAKGWGSRSDPSPGWIAWLLWGGDPGKRWCNSIWNRINKSDGGVIDSDSMPEYHPLPNQKKKKVKKEYEMMSESEDNKDKKDKRKIEKYDDGLFMDSEEDKDKKDKRKIEKENKYYTNEFMDNKLEEKDKSDEDEKQAGVLSSERRNDLSDSNFAYIDSNGGRHLPIHDAAHVRNALARFSQTHFESEEAKTKAKNKLESAARKFKIGGKNKKEKEKNVYGVDTNEFVFEQDHVIRY